MNRYPVFVLATALCLLVWALALGSTAGPDLLVGLVIVVLVLLASGRRRLAPGRSLGPGTLARRTAAFVPFLLVVGWKVVRGTWEVALVIVGLRRPEATGIVAVPMEERSDVGVAVAGLVLTLTPGENLLELDWERRLMLVHALDATDPDRLRRSERSFYQRFQRAVFP